jgi:predicted TIM-barrel fold metal-dependent hydrolase
VEEKFDPFTNPGFTAERRHKLGDLGETRLKDMDAQGITQQVISATMPGADLLNGPEGIRFAKATNDRLAQAVRASGASLGLLRCLRSC